jgi:hypothetical protein
MALEDGHAAAAEGFHPRFVIVHAGDLVPDFGKADGCNESHISGPNHADGNWLRHALMLFVAERMGKRWHGLKKTHQGQNHNRRKSKQPMRGGLAL